ncbi:hypothetical protein AB1Y20_005210 [Prymnesium parvum]|uniref:YIP1 family member 3 n=1 Tax=Prymnesium parvum TaxID=97485 RepID=A0AB34J3H8_PRYPA
MKPHGDSAEDDGAAMDFYTPPGAETGAGDIAIDMSSTEGMMSVPVQRRGGRTSEASLESGAKQTSMPTGAVGLSQLMTPSMVSTLLRGAHEQAAARGIFDIYGQIDALRPHFDVETDEVRQRLCWAFHPKKGAMLLKEYDLYSPVMLAFTLAALVVMGQKGAHRGATMDSDSTLIGTSLGAAFTLWFLHTSFLCGVARMLRLPARPVQLGCASGYALAGVCIPLAVALLQSSVAFYSALASLGGCSALTLGLSIKQLANGSSQASLVGAASGGLYILLTLYVRWRYFLV